ncbi:hypothetical protein LAZ67_9000467 [Cordylochernes scorpioides]|uniref:Uncharacterized protein n=1 Tax=Cordylochernes scorpioides TaxID=51811 RepID=A0ABY6KXJ1_9ARAC|nr:hypothetical protein LAZ67_9000467 [Cordylochernes scorpioides]
MLEAFNIIGRHPDLQAWIFGTGLEQDDISIRSSAKSRVYRHFIQVTSLGMVHGMYRTTESTGKRNLRLYGEDHHLVGVNDASYNHQYLSTMRELDSTKLQTHPDGDMMTLWTFTVNLLRSILWADLGRNCFLGHRTDIVLQLAP